MRRKEKEIKELKDLETIIQKAHVIRIALCTDNMPYIVPVNFGYEKGAFYFHCAKVGKKLDMIIKNPNVAFEIDTDHELVIDEMACKFTMKFRSIIGTGTAYIIEDKKEKTKGLDIIMSQYSEMDSFKYNDKAIDAVSIVKIDVNRMTGKQSGY